MGESSMQTTPVSQTTPRLIAPLRARAFQEEAPALPQDAFQPSDDLLDEGSLATAVEEPDEQSAGQPTPFGRRLARHAREHATRSPGDGRHCWKWVADDLDRSGIHLTGMDAWMAADQLARRKEFREMKGIAAGDLPDLPAGAIVVWDRGPGHESGHVSVALGDGREASDVIRPQITAYGTRFRVFLPR